MSNGYLGGITSYWKICEQGLMYLESKANLSPLIGNKLAFDV